jgi:RHS repeat-associated protein
MDYFGPGLTDVTHNYAYDPIGNILQKNGISYFYCNHPDQPAAPQDCTGPIHPSTVAATSDGRRYAYDANGNTVTGAGRTFTWDVDNRVTGLVAPGGTVDMVYDYTGRRVKKSAPTGITYFPFNGYEIGPSGTIIKYIRVGVETLAENKGGAKRFYHNDHLGGVNIITDIFAGIEQLNEYDPWGKVSRSEGSAVPKHGFNGKELDPESGLYYYGGRYYDPDLARFVSPDPFVQEPGNPQNLNRYSYTLNNPQNYIDPSGYFFLSNLFKSIFNAFKKLWEFTKKAWNAVIGNPIGRIVLAAVAAVATYGAFTIVTGAAYSGTAAGVTAAAAASAQAVMEIPPVSEFLARAGPVATFFASLVLNFGFQYGYATAVTEPVGQIKEVSYQTDPPPVETQQAVARFGGDNYSIGGEGVPNQTRYVNYEVFDKSGRLRMIVARADALGTGSGDGLHLGALADGLRRWDAIAPKLSNLYGPWGISHQAFNITALQAGLRVSTLNFTASLTQGLAFTTSSLLAGPYGGGRGSIPHSIYRTNSAISERYSCVGRIWDFSALCPLSC